MDMDATDDAVLLGRFAETGSEEAFAALVQRHGGMVYRTCRQVLRDGHDAEDAAQAVFVVLARSAGRLAGLRSLAAWLHRVAVRIALNIRTAAQRRSRHEKEAAMQPVQPPSDDLGRFLPLLDESLEELSEAYRQPLILHHLEGRSYADCCRILGCNEGVLAMRLSRGREMLRKRLASRGAAVPALALGALLGQAAAAGEMPAVLAAGTVQAAGGAVAAPVATLAKNALSMLFWMKVKTAALATAAALVAGALTVPVVVHVMAAETPKAEAGGIPVPSVSSTSAYIRPAVEPRLAAVLARRVELGQVPPLTWEAAVERILCALPPGDLLPVRLLRQGSVWQAIREPKLDADIERHCAMAARRPVSLPSAGAVQDLIDAMARQLDAEWIATDETVVLALRYPAELRQRLFAPFADRGRPRAERLAAARRIIEARDPDGYRILLRAQADDGDADGAGIAGETLAEHRGAAVADAGLAALVRRGFGAGEGARLAAAALARHRAAAGDGHPDVASIRLLAFLAEAQAVPVLDRTLRESRAPAGLGKLLGKLAKGGETPEARQAEAASALGRIGGAAAVQSLLAAFAAESSQQTFCAIVTALGEARDPLAVEPLTAYLAAHVRDEHAAWQCRTAILALGAIGDRRGGPAVLAALSAASPHLLGFINEAAEAALPRVGDDATWQAMGAMMVDGADERVRQMAAGVLAALRDPRSAPALVKVMGARGSGFAGEWIRRGRAGQALARIADPGTFAALQRIVLESGDEATVRDAARALAGTLQPPALDLLLDAFRRAPDGGYRIQSIGAALGSSLSATQAAMLRSIAIDDPSPVRRATAAAQYGRQPGEGSIPFLLERLDAERTFAARSILVEAMHSAVAGPMRERLFRIAAEDGDEGIRSQAVWQLVRMGSDARIMPMLTRMLAGDPSARVRGACASALESVADTLRRSSVYEEETDIAAARTALERNKAIAIDALIAALGRDRSPEVRRAVANTGLLSNRGPGEDRLAAAFLAALANEADPQVQCGLVRAFFLRMREDPALAPVMLGILRDPGRAKSVRDQACQNLEAGPLQGQSAEVKDAIRQYQRESRAPAAGPAPARPASPPAGHDF